MKYLLAFFLITAFVGASAKEWASPIDKKYRQIDEQIFIKFDRARSILDTWSGQNYKLQEAETLLREVLFTYPDYAPAHREYGRFFIMSGYINNHNFQPGSLNPAEASILKSIEIEPEYADSYVLLGHLYTRMHRHDEARYSLIKAEEIGTEIPWLHLNWADLLLKEGKLSMALERYQTVKNSKTSNKKAYSAALSGLTNIYRSLGDNEKAKQAFEAELKYSPDVAWYWGNYAGFLLFNYGDTDDAIEKGKQALSIMDYGMGRFILGSALYTKWAELKQDPTNAKEAQKYFEEAWKIYPYPEKVIQETITSPYTNITATLLIEWLENNSNPPL